MWSYRRDRTVVAYDTVRVSLVESSRLSCAAVYMSSTPRSASAPGVLQLQLLQTSIKYEKRALPTSTRQLCPSNACGDSTRLFHGSPGAQPSSPMLARVASHRWRAQRARPSPPAADGNWSTRLLCFPAGCLKPMALPTPLQCNPGTHHHVVSAGIASGSYVQARGVQGTCAKNCARWNSMRRATTLCMPVMGVARADGLYGHG